MSLPSSVRRNFDPSITPSVQNTGSPVNGPGGFAFGPLGSGLGMLGGILESFFGPSYEDQFKNSAAPDYASFLAKGGGQRNASDAIGNYRASATGFGSLFNDQQRAASEGKGPGGGLGVYQGVDDYLKANTPTLKEKSFLEKLGGTLGSIFISE